MSLREHIEAEARPAEEPQPQAVVAEPVVEAAPEDEADSTKPDQELSDAGRALRQGRLDKRIAKLKELNEQLRINKELRANPERPAPAPLAPTAGVAPAGTTDDPEPDPKAYPAEEYDPAYIRAVAKWEARQTFKAVHQQSSARVAQEERSRSLDVIETATREKYSDYDAVTATLADALTQHPYAGVIPEFARTSKVGGDVWYHAAKDEEASADLIAARTAFDVMRVLTRIEARLLEPAKPAAPKPITAAPAPPSQTVGGSASAVEPDTRKGVPLKDHIRIEEAEIAERRKRGYRY
jgi:hypothetical protein